MSEETEAPHGRDENGEPLAPFGYKTDGTPRKSNRGAMPGQRGNSGGRTSSAKTAKKSPTDAKRKDMLVELSATFIEAPLAAASMSPMVQKKFGEKQADALAGDSLIFGHFAPHLADALITLSETKPRVLSWMDGVEEKAPYLQLMMVGIQMTKAFVGNHLNPDPRVAQAGRQRAQMRAQQMAAEVERQAREAGLHPEQQHAAA